MNIMVFGVGGVGGYFGGLLAAVFAGSSTASVSFIARGEHLRVIRDQGLTLMAEERTLNCRPALATDDAREAPAPGLVLLCVKGYDLDAALAALAPLVRADTVVLPLLNGVDVAVRVKARLHASVVLPACVYVGTHLERPGVVVQKGGDARILTGPDPARTSWSPVRLLSLFSDAGIRCQWLDDPRPEIWKKFLFIAAYGLATAASGLSLDRVYEDPQWSVKTLAAMREIAQIARAENVHLPGDAVEAAYGLATGFPPGTKTSFQRDVEQPGRRHEGDLFAGTILTLGRRHGIPTPAAENLAAMIRPCGAQ